MARRGDCGSIKRKRFASSVSFCAPCDSLKKKSSAAREPLRFEDLLAQLEQIVSGLEEGQVGLSESLAQYEKGITLLRQCHELLAEAERKVEVLTGFDAQGNPITEPLHDAGDGSLEEKAAARSKRRSHPAGGSRSTVDPIAGDDDLSEVPF